MRSTRLLTLGHPAIERERASAEEGKPLSGLLGLKRGKVNDEDEDDGSRETKAKDKDLQIADPLRLLPGSRYALDRFT